MYCGDTCGRRACGPQAGKCRSQDGRHHFLLVRFAQQDAFPPFFKGFATGRPDADAFDGFEVEASRLPVLGFLLDAGDGAIGP
jgi:hypothetical protein